MWSPTGVAEYDLQVLKIGWDYSAYRYLFSDLLQVFVNCLCGHVVNIFFADHDSVIERFMFFGHTARQKQLKKCLQGKPRTMPRRFLINRYLD